MAKRRVARVIVALGARLDEPRRPPALLYRFKTDDEAIQMANNTKFGLASYFYSRDIGLIWRIAEALEYGKGGINEGIISPQGPLARSPFFAA